MHVVTNISGFLKQYIELLFMTTDIVIVCCFIKVGEEAIFIISIFRVILVVA